MRIDRDAFLAAVAALAGCQQDTSRSHAPPVIPLVRPAIAAVTAPPPPPPVVPVVEDPPAPVVEPKRTAPRRRQTPKQWFHGLSTKDREHVTTACEIRANEQCRASLRMLVRPPAPAEIDDDGVVTAAAEPPPAPAPDPVASLPHDKVDAYCKEDFPAPSCETPLVVAFEGQPVEFAPAGHERFAFVPGEPAATDWPSAATPWIALDLDGDGAISSGAELFGSSTVLPGGGRATNGFLALAVLDANGDGALDAGDPMFGKLVLWSDRDGDHRSSPSELQPLSTVVTRISLAFTRDARCNDRDDCEGERGTLHWRDAAGGDHAGAVVDVYIPRK